MLCAEQAYVHYSSLTCVSPAIMNHTACKYKVLLACKSTFSMTSVFKSKLIYRRTIRSREFSECATSRLFLCGNSPHLFSVQARRGHGANTLTCDWWEPSCGWVDVNARYKRACKEPVFNLSVFSVQCPYDRVEPRVCVCVSNLITLHTSSYSCFLETHCGTMVKLAKVRDVYANFAVLTSTPLIHADARGLLRRSCCVEKKRKWKLVAGGCLLTDHRCLHRFRNSFFL